MDSFLIGDVPVQIEYNGLPVRKDGYLRLFTYDGPVLEKPAQLMCTEQSLIPYQQNMLQRDNHVYGIYGFQNEKVLIYHWGNMFHGFAVHPDRFAVSFAPRMKKQPPFPEDWFFSVISFHRQLLLRGGCILHSAYLDIGGSAILFSGPSNVGKSTQAQLWADIAHARVINGDRCVLRQRLGRWHAFGYPCCGTSSICHNETHPLACIVILSQAPSNYVQELTPAEKIRALVSAMELYPWEPRELDLAFDLAREIAQQVPMVRLCCRPDADAVSVLKNYLEDKDYAHFD